jgi:hypothetical protein
MSIENSALFGVLVMPYVYTLTSASDCVYDQSGQKFFKRSLGFLDIRLENIWDRVDGIQS